MKCATQHSPERYPQWQQKNKKIKCQKEKNAKSQHAKQKSLRKSGTFAFSPTLFLWIKLQDVLKNYPP